MGIIEKPERIDRQIAQAIRKASGRKKKLDEDIDESGA